MRLATTAQKESQTVDILRQRPRDSSSKSFLYGQQQQQWEQRGRVLTGRVAALAGFGRHA